MTFESRLDCCSFVGGADSSAHRADNLNASPLRNSIAVKYHAAAATTASVVDKEKNKIVRPRWPYDMRPLPKSTCVSL